uniref:Uncharacterized protein n=1 Tax=Cercocebus atys TaxID=9531 RepID=A0A2K5MZ55_CERAT
MFNFLGNHHIIFHSGCIPLYIPTGDAHRFQFLHILPSVAEVLNLFVIVYPQRLGQCLAHCRCLISICWMNEWEALASEQLYLGTLLPEGGTQSVSVLPTRGPKIFPFQSLFSSETTIYLLFIYLLKQVPAAWEAEAGESLEPGRRRLQ